MPRKIEHYLHIIKLTGVGKFAVKNGKQVVVRVPVEWPFEYRKPYFAEAYIDKGGTPIWGFGPYLKVPNQDSRDGEKFVDRVFCPWGYPPRKLRVQRAPLSVDLISVGLERSESGVWE